MPKLASRKGSPPPGAGLVDGEEKRMEERNPPSSLKKEGGFGSTVVVRGERDLTRDTDGDGLR